jgi:hypothetical protein
MDPMRGVEKLKITPALRIQIATHFFRFTHAPLWGRGWRAHAGEAVCPRGHARAFRRDGEFGVIAFRFQPNSRATKDGEGCQWRNTPSPPRGSSTEHEPVATKDKSQDNACCELLRSEDRQNDDTPVATRETQTTHVTPLTLTRSRVTPGRSLRLPRWSPRPVHTIPARSTRSPRHLRGTREQQSTHTHARTRTHTHARTHERRQRRPARVGTRTPRHGQARQPASSRARPRPRRGRRGRREGARAPPARDGGEATHAGREEP